MQDEVERTVFSHIPIGVIVLPLQPLPFAYGTQPWVNKRMCALLGYDMERMIDILKHGEGFNRYKPARVT